MCLRALALKKKREPCEGSLCVLVFRQGCNMDVYGDVKVVQARAKVGFVSPLIVGQLVCMVFVILLQLSLRSGSSGSGD